MRRINRAKTQLNIRVSHRTLKQWRRCLAVGRLKGLGGDRLLARALRLVLMRMVDELNDAGVDWKAEIARSDSWPDCPDVDAESRRPMISE